MRCRQFISVLVILCTMGVHTNAQQTTQGNSGLTVRAYNVSDLVRVSSDYPLTVQLQTLAADLLGRSPRDGNINVSMSPPEKPPIEAQIVPLIQLITQNVEPTSWNENGGKISNLGTTLVVRQTSDNQARVQQLLDEIRRSTGPAQVVTVRATWVECAPRELPDPRSEVTADWVGKQKTYCESQLTCFNGQTVHITSGRTRQVVSDLTPIVATGAVAYDPTIRNVLSAVTLQITPQLVPGSDSAILDIHSTMNDASPTGQNVDYSIKIAATPAPTTGPSIERVNFSSQEFQTTSRLPLRKKIIVGGMTLNPSGGGDQAGQQLYLVVEIDTGK